ncbi:diguanylate cyclase [Marinobacterium jannaschii]|uniref:diguanylate cyclase n=1 Tax=Marinobacterium jannaschii TaxID=64970 RepID=UPI0004818AC3|nr:diguanylate cyclase [Marinobacterium jannaschii]
MDKYIVYGDLNCPFCYALQEQLAKCDLLNQVDWRLIEHAPDIGVYGRNAESQAELAGEVFIVRSRAPQVQLALPPIRSDSRFAILCIIAAMELDDAKARQLRHNLYRSLWIEGLDIANTAVIYDCITDAGLPGELNIEERHEEMLAHWQSEWEHGDFALRIPVVAAPDGRRMLGLAPPEQLLSFFGGAEVEASPESMDSCRHIDRQTICLLTGRDTDKVWPLIAALRDDFNILLPASAMELKQLLNGSEAPDLVLLDSSEQWQTTLELCHDLSQQQLDHNTPLALVGEDISESQEVAVYDAGAADYFTTHRAPAVLRARVRTLLQLKRSHDLLERAARIDGLTQVYNRREFERTLEVEWRRGQRSKRSLSLILLDIDHFKQYNDHYGHLTGDGCLRTVAQTIKSSVRRVQDMACRYGGEEFAVILPETDIYGASQLGEKIRRQIAELQIKHDGLKPGATLTISIGIACMNPADVDSPHLLIEAADQAMYQAKADGRNRVVSAD